MVVYDVWFRAEMAGLDEFTEWMRSEGSVRYPPVPRHDHSSSTVTAAGFAQAWEADLRCEIEMTHDELVSYLMTHSERIAAIQSGREIEAEQRRFLSEGIAPFYQDALTRSMAFGIDVEAFTRVPNSARPPSASLSLGREARAQRTPNPLAMCPCSVMLQRTALGSTFQTSERHVRWL